MDHLLTYKRFKAIRQNLGILRIFCFIAVILGFHGVTSAEGTKQLEPIDAPVHSFCRISLTQNSTDNRIPFALLDCSEEYRLNIRINDFTTEKIYLGFGVITDYYDETITFTDVRYQVKDPAGNIVAGYSIRPLPANPGDAGLIETRDEANFGPDINNTNPAGYKPLIITPERNGDYTLEFKIPDLGQTEARVFKFFDVTVATGNSPIPGRLWSKAWQLSSSSITAAQNASFSLFYIYSNDSIVTRFDCNGLAGGIWAIYSNEWGCATTGTWSERRRSIEGNATVQPEHKIFLNDPDPEAFPSGHIGEMIDFEVLPYECDTVITFSAKVSKSGNIEILLDIPPLNPNSVGQEDVQLGYNVTAGSNILLPAWDGKNAFGVPLTNGTQVEARIRFLNGLSNIPLFDVEDNPKGFKVDIHRPLPVSGSAKLNLFWDDTMLPPDNQPTSNVIDGCVYTGLEPVTGCHEWSIENNNIGDYNTINSWWYYSTDDVLIIPITLKLSPPSGNITGPGNICAGQIVTFRTSSIPFAQKYIWHLSGPGVFMNIEKDAPDTTFIQLFSLSMLQGLYTISVFGRNMQCGDGEPVLLSSYFYDNLPPPVNGISSVCNNSKTQYQIPGSYTSLLWNISKGEIIGSPYANPVTISWHTTGNDTIKVLATSVECGTRLSALPIQVHPVANAGFVTLYEATSCPGLPLYFSDRSVLASGSIVSRNWEWGDGLNHFGNDTLVSHIYSNTGTVTVKLRVTTDHGCESQSNNEIRIIPDPEASFSIFHNCLSDTVQLTDLSTGINIAAWNWKFDPVMTSISSSDLQHPDVVYSALGQYPVQLIVTNRYGCKDTLTKQITIHSPPSAAYIHNTPCLNAGIIFSDQSIPADTSLAGFIWKVKGQDNTVQTYTGNPAKIYFELLTDYTVELTVMDHFGCSGSIADQVSVKTPPDCSFDYTEDSGNIRGLLHFNNYTAGASAFTWDFGNNLTSSMKEPEIKYSSEGEYDIMLVATSEDGCTDTTYKEYYYLPGLWLPTAFTPNNDGMNDFFRPVTQRNTLSPYTMQIFNNWGELIFTSSSPEIGWNGTFKGIQCPAGEYIYTIRFNETGMEESKTAYKKGLFTLIR